MNRVSTTRRENRPFSKASSLQALFLQEQTGRSLKLTIHLHLALRLTMSVVRLHSSIQLNVVILKRKENSTGNREFLDKDNFTDNQGLRPINRIAHNTVTHHSGLGLSLKCCRELIHNHPSIWKIR